MEVRVAFACSSRGKRASSSLPPGQGLYYDTRRAMSESFVSQSGASQSSASESEVSKPGASKPGNGEFLWGFWYPALRSDRVRGANSSAPMLLEVPLVLGRDSAGKPFALRDVCPHRAFPLSFGRFDGAIGRVRLSRLAIRRAHGPVPHIPSLTADSKLKCERIYAGSFPCEERDGYIWAS